MSKLQHQSSTRGFYRFVFVWIEGVFLNLLVQLYPILYPTAFLRSFAPVFAADDEVVQHFLVVCLTRCWAYMIVVFGLIEISILTYGDFQAAACFQSAAAVDDLLHIAVFSTLFLANGAAWDAGAAINYLVPLALFVLRCIWLKRNKAAILNRDEDKSA